MCDGVAFACSPGPHLEGVQQVADLAHADRLRRSLRGAKQHTQLFALFLVQARAAPAAAREVEGVWHGGRAAL